MKKTYQVPMSCIEVFALDTAITLDATSGDTTDQQLAKGVFDAEDASDKEESDWSDVW